MMDMESAKEIIKEDNCLSFAIKRNCAMQTHGLKRSRRKYYTVWVGPKLRLILCRWLKAIESI